MKIIEITGEEYKRLGLRHEFHTGKGKDAEQQARDWAKYVGVKKDELVYKRVEDKRIVWIVEV